MRICNENFHWDMFFLFLYAKSWLNVIFLKKRFYEDRKISVANVGNIEKRIVLKILI